MTNTKIKYEDLPTVYDAKETESEIYKFWEDGEYFKADAKSPKPAYSIVIPPPNVTGVLHMGHGLDETLQDTKNYVRTLVTEEMNLGNLIESSIRTMNYEENKEEDEDIEDEIMEDVIPEITDEDFMEQEEFLESEQEKDAQLTEELALGKNN